MPVAVKSSRYFITFVVILGWHTPQDVPIQSIHNVIATAMSICVAVGTKSWILQSASAYVVKGQRLNRFGVEAGAGVTFYLSPDVESSVGYEGKFRSHYQDHTGYVSAKYKF